jgi:hypothetical protein
MFNQNIPNANISKAISLARHILNLILKFYVPQQLVEFQLVQWGKISNTKQSLS